MLNRFRLGVERFKQLRAAVRPYILAGSGLLALVVSVIAICTNILTINNIKRNEAMYNEEGYSRHEGAVSLALHTVADANGKPYEAGQSAALIYLAANGRLEGYITLNVSQIRIASEFLQADNISLNGNILYLQLQKSIFCKTKITSYESSELNTHYSFYVPYSVLRNAELNGIFRAADFLASDLSRTTLDNLSIEYARFAGATLSGAVIRGGHFNNVDFQGADLSKLTTERGYIGVGDYTYGNGTYDDGVLATYEEIVKPEWPVLFGKDIGINETLERVGRQDQGNNIRVVDFTDARFQFADLRGSHLENSNINQKQINEACVDDQTVFPTDRSLPPPSERCVLPPRFMEARARLQSPRVLTPPDANCDLP